MVRPTKEVCESELEAAKLYNLVGTISILQAMKTYDLVNENEIKNNTIIQRIRRLVSKLKKEISSIINTEEKSVSPLTDKTKTTVESSSTTLSSKKQSVSLSLSAKRKLDGVKSIRIISQQAQQNRVNNKKIKLKKIMQ